MPVNKSRIVKNAFILYIRMAIVLFISLFSARIVLDQLGASDYGTYNVVGGVVTMFNFIITALSQGIQRFFNVCKGRGDYNALNKYFWSGLVVMSLFSLVLILLSETIGLWFLNAKMNIPVDRMSAANWLFQIAILSTVIGFFTSPFNALISAHEDFNIYAFLSIGQAALLFTNALLLKVAPIDKLIFYAFSILLINILYMMIIILICRNRYKNIYPQRHKEVDKYKELVGFSGWTTLGTGMYVLGTQGANIILNVFFGTIVNAARGIAFQISSKLDEFINGIQQATNPQIVQLYARGEYQEVQSLILDNMRWSFTMYWLIALPLIFEMDYVLDLWLVDVPEYTALFTIIILFRGMLKCFERPINAVNFAIGKMKPINIFATFSVVSTMILMVILFMMGQAPYWAFVLDCVSITMCVGYYMCHARKHSAFSFRRFVKEIVIPIVAVIICSYVGTRLLRLVSFTGFAQLLVTLTITTLLTCFCSFFILFTKQNREKVIQIVKERIKFKNSY